MSELTYREAISLALADAMEEDGDVFVLGEDVGAAGVRPERLPRRFGERPSALSSN